MNFGVQTFTIRKWQKKDLEKAYLPLIKLGILDYEIARIHFDKNTGQAVRALMDKYGIRVRAIQVKPKQVFGDVQSVVDFCKSTGCTNVVLSQLPFSCVLGREEKFYDFVATLDRQFEIYEAHGITLAYHHHNWEYVTLTGGKTRMQELLDEFVKPENFDKKGSKYAPSPANSCFVCDQVEQVMKKMVDNVITRYDNDPEFAKLYADQPCYCLKHFEQLGVRAYPVLGRKKAPAFIKATAEITRKNLEELQKDLKEMQLAFDYRNSGKPVSEQAKNAVERTVEFLG